MEKSRNYFNLLSGQRYFHLVAFEFDSNYSGNSLLKDCGIDAKFGSFKKHDNEEFTIEQTRIISHLKFFNSEEDFSVNQDGNAPFHYDIFSIQLKNNRVVILGFPFKNLAKNIVQKLIEEKNIRKQASFLKPNLDKLIKLNYKEAFVEEGFFSHFSEVELILLGDTNISTVVLDGDRPLDSSLYKDIFYKKILEEQCKVARCTLRCEIETNSSIDIPKSRANIHLDTYGNFKLYIHGNGNNIFTLPLMFSFLKRLESLEKSSLNPIEKLRESTNE